MTSKQVKNQVRDSVERGFDSLHRIADVVTFPLAPLDGAIHGTARGILNWLTDNHPEDRSNGHNHNNDHSNGPPPPGPPQYPPQPPYYPPQPYPGYPSGYPGRQNGKYDNSGQQKIHGIKNKTGKNKGNDNGAVKIGNFVQPQYPHYGACPPCPPPPPPPFPPNHGYCGYPPAPPPPPPPPPPPVPYCYPPQPSQGYYPPPQPTPGYHAYPGRWNGKYDNSGQQKIHHIKNRTDDNHGNHNGAVKIGNFGRFDE
ncbi:hypothetical protein FEM48_Zijuj12G0202300 [Ziziphus jujuba var. spinosa]|uniref:Uncharacterized protein n=1 Tax=Ziziphus jujuba var. spinosa TaxID=714518 RepID=A0A978UFB8_ZIZJJ|nr:hypothetical protein FEM48_Zijuj12G0202300 [Ziziphus jujuba var. spinosa]